jgi:hypothetical protein
VNGISDQESALCACARLDAAVKESDKTRKLIIGVEFQVACNFSASVGDEKLCLHDSAARTFWNKNHMRVSHVRNAVRHIVADCDTILQRDKITQSSKRLRGHDPTSKKIAPSVHQNRQQFWRPRKCPPHRTEPFPAFSSVALNLPNPPFHPSRIDDASSAAKE